MASNMVHDSGVVPNITYIGRNIFSALNDIIFINKTQLMGKWDVGGSRRVVGWVKRHDSCEKV